MSAPNAELAYAVLDHIEAHPERHDQGSFLRPSLDLRLMYDRVGRLDVTAEIAVEHCGTTACFAGWTALLSGKTLNHEGDVRTDGDRSADIAYTAQSLLGIGAADSWHLFFEAQSLDQVRCFVSEIFGPRPAVTQ
ncbi:MAG: hypothetical protein QOJ49_1259 [Actinomycetota bacterium]|nr:hypothetical protein [Actinomycetota bacterium]